MESIRLSSYWHRAPIRTRKYMALFVDFFCAAVRIDKRVVFHQSQTTLENSKAGVFVHYVSATFPGFLILCQRVIYVLYLCFPMALSDL